MDMPSISDATRINFRVSPARRLQPAGDRQADKDKSDQFKTASGDDPVLSPDDDSELSFASHRIFQSVWMQQGTDPSSSEGDMDAIRGQHAACENRRDTMGAPLKFKYYPYRFSPPGVACGAKGGLADFQTTASCPD